VWQKESDGSPVGPGAGWGSIWSFRHPVGQGDKLNHRIAMRPCCLKATPWPPCNPMVPFVAPTGLCVGP
jgi:hypothetical protein